MDEKISQLTELTQVNGAHFLPITDTTNGNATKKISVANLLSSIPGSNTPATVFAFNNGVLQKQDPNSTAWTNFTIKGINYGPTPPGFDPNNGLLHDPFANPSVALWFAQQFSAINGNAIRVYWNVGGQLGGSLSQVSGQVDQEAVLKFLDIMYAHGIYVMFNVFMNFYPAFNTGKVMEWYKNSSVEALLACVNLVKGHPATLGYILGNETNVNLNGLITLNQWWTFANNAGKEVKNLDPNHIYGPCSALTNPSDMSNAITAEQSGLLANCDYHGTTLYRGNTWNQPSTGTSLWAQWQPSNSKRLVILEAGNDSYNANLGTEDQASQANSVANLWTTRNATICPGVFFFEAFDELWKAGNLGTPPTNDGNYTNSYFAANTDSFTMYPDGQSQEQYFGWWKYITAFPFAVPPTPKTVVATMKNTW